MYEIKVVETESKDPSSFVIGYTETLEMAEADTRLFASLFSTVKRKAGAVKVYASQDGETVYESNGLKDRIAEAYKALDPREEDEDEDEY